MKEELIASKDIKSPISEVFRTLRTNIQFSNTNKNMKVLLITSTFPEEGKSWVSSNLAVTFAQAGKKVVLIDADMRKGRQHNIFKVAPKPGLSNYLSQMEDEKGKKASDDVNDYVQETEVENLSLISAGTIPPNPSELLTSDRMKELLNQLKTNYDLVIIDGTPCKLVSDSVILSSIVDLIVIVAAYKFTKKDDLKEVIRNIKDVGGNIVGVVLNKISVSNNKYQKTYYYYGGEDKKGSK